MSSKPNFRRAPTVTLQRYLDLIEHDSELVECIKDIFFQFDMLIAFIRIMYPSVGECVVIDLIESMDVDARCCGNTISISRGAIDLALSRSRNKNQNDIVYTKKKDVDKFEYIGGLLWMIAHEYTHCIRGHGDLWNTRPDLHRGLEFDADSYAVAILFRYFKNVIYPDLPDMDVRKRVLAAMHWHMRKLLEEQEDVFDEGKAHPATFIRLWYAIDKLSYIGLAHVNYGTTLEVESSMRTLVQHLILCEENHNVKYRIPKDDSPLLKYIKLLTSGKINYIKSNVILTWSLAESEVKNRSRLVEDCAIRGDRFHFRDFLGKSFFFENCVTYTTDGIFMRLRPTFNSFVGCDVPSFTPAKSFSSRGVYNVYPALPVPRSLLSFLGSRLY